MAELTNRGTNGERLAQLQDMEKIMHTQRTDGQTDGRTGRKLHVPLTLDRGFSQFS